MGHREAHGATMTWTALKAAADVGSKRDGHRGDEPD